ncbi:MAG: ABC transporter permease [Gammaproteobacteria bacterium]|jgi:simple sugar transport system permease protein|nr:ABC transporter permease [Gammaproteobacteria bacterium]|tara:strand:- start:545 stop:1612 length:1068 start_codon:yes stop_codon:yes gene_type:complete
MLRLEPRSTQSFAAAWLSPVMALVLTVFTGGVIFLAMGKDPSTALYIYFVEPLTTTSGLSEVAVKAGPLILIGIGLSFGFRAGVWNIGAEGQYIAGAIAGGGLAVYFHESESTLLLPAMLVLGTLGGMAWAAVPALLKTRFNANEILVSLMLVYVAELLLVHLVQGPWRNPQGWGFPGTRMFPDVATMPLLFSGKRVHLGTLITLAIPFIAWFILVRTRFGFTVRVFGSAPLAARHAGVHSHRMIWQSLLIGGGFAGLAGVIEATGTIGQLVPNISPGYGFTAIIVAFLGRLHPAGVLLAGIAIAVTYIGGEGAQISVGLPKAVTGLFQGIILFYLLAFDLFTRYRIIVSSRATE